MAHRVAPQAKSDLDEIWYFVAIQSGSTEIAGRLIENITDRFLLLSRFPEIGRGRDEELRPGLRSFSVGAYLIFYRKEGDEVLVLRVIHGSRDIERFSW
jgi:toxin ParE1/3/4